MLKTIGLPMMALAALMAFSAPPSAEARVRIAVAIGVPVYSAPAYAAPVTPYPYPYPYAYAPPAYGAPAPVYADPYVTLGFGGGHGYVRGHDRSYHEFRDGSEGVRGRR